MPPPEGPFVQQALESVREGVLRVFDALLQPHEALADTEPDTAIGAPREVARYAQPADLGAVTARVESKGRDAWSLHQVAEREKQIQELVRDYQGGAYSRTTAADWVGKVQDFRRAVLADINTAMQAPRGWDRLDLASALRGGAKESGKELLTPQDVAPQLRLSERTVRRRIQEGKLGPWHKQGTRWVIASDAFMKFWTDRLREADAEVPRPPAPHHSAAELEERLVHVRLKPGQS